MVKYLSLKFIFLVHRNIDDFCILFLHTLVEIIPTSSVCEFQLLCKLISTWYCHFFLFKKNLFILFLAALGLRSCARAFSSCGERGLLIIAVRRLLIAVASLVVEHWLQVLGLQQLWRMGSVVVACRLQSAGSVVVVHRLSCSLACGIFPDQGSNPCPLHWQVDS